MGRVVGFVGIGSRAEVSDVCFNLSQNLSLKNQKVCVFDFYFSMNVISQKFNKNSSFDLKDYLLGKIDYDGILTKTTENLCFIKSNSLTFDYLKYKHDLCRLIKILSLKFDYILVDININDKNIFAFALDVCKELILVFDNHVNSIILTSKILKLLDEKTKIENINLVMNKSQIMGQISKKFMTRLDIENYLEKDIMFEFPSVLCNATKLRSKNKKLPSLDLQFCNCFITNSILHKNYAKYYRGVVGKIKRLLYENYE